MVKKIVFCDIDGTISDDRSRADLLIKAHKMYEDIKPKSTKHYDDYHSALFEDNMWHNIANLLLQYHADNFEIVLVTARTECWREETKKWFISIKPMLWHKITSLYMRHKSDVRSNERVKADHIRVYLRENKLTPENVTAIIDDSQVVLTKLGNEFPQAILLLADKGQWSRYRVSAAPPRPDYPKPPPPPTHSDDITPKEIRSLSAMLTEENAIYRQEEPKSQTVDTALKRLADLYCGRNKLYGDNYKKFGALMVALQNFVPGGAFPAETEDDWNRLGVMVMLASKISRYCAIYKDGGHSDSLDDLSVYSQMLNEIDREIRSLEIRSSEKEEKS